MGYSVRDMNGCKLIKGHPPVRDLVALMAAWGNDWVIDGELAKQMGATLVVGPIASVKKWRDELNGSASE